jgi:Ser/Thr protein kinase RdoA (MazF antagonist)
LSYLKYLHKYLVPVAPPIASLQNQYVHLAVVEDKCYTVSAYQKAKGKDCWSRGIDGRDRFRIIGQTLGRMHRLSMLYNNYKVAKRRQWDENPHLVKARYVLHNYNADLTDKFDSYISLMCRFPKKKSSFGLVHGDFLFSNYFFDDDNNI